MCPWVIVKNKSITLSKSDVNSILEADTFEHFQTNTSLGLSPPKSIQTFPDLSKLSKPNPNLSWTSLNLSKTFQTKSKHIQTFWNLYKTLQKYTNVSKPIQTFPNFPETCPRLIKLIPNHPEIRIYPDWPKPTKTLSELIPNPI